MKDEGILDWGGGGVQTLVIGRVVAIIVDQLRKRRRPRVPQYVNAARGLGGGGEGLLPYKRLMEMCHRMGSHFHDWIDYGVAFSIESLVGSHIFCG